jgi:predicted nucleic acid-binding protein
VAGNECSVLVDTNVIIEAWRARGWKALTSRHQVETVEMVVIETQTGFQRRRQTQQIDQAVLMETLGEVHPVSERERAGLAVRAPDLMLDPGERDLWAHALARQDAWVLCGPDKASLRLGVRLGFGERLVSLEGLWRDAGFTARDLRENFTARWHQRTVGEMMVLERGRP